MMRRLLLWVVVAVVVSTASPAWADRVIVKCERPCAAVIGAVEKAGGTVTYRYRYVDAIAAEVPGEGLAGVRAVAGAGAVRKDLIVDMPTVARDRDGSRLLAEEAAESGAPIDLAAGAGTGAPAAYLFNNAQLNVSSVHGAGFLGQGMKVAIIDSGIRPGFPHISLGTPSVIGGEDFVDDGLGFSNFANGGHGTFVAGMIAAHVTFTYGPASGLLAAVKAECPSCVSGDTQIPMIGSAPSSSLYALRVFGPTGGAPESRIIAAMERVLELRENFDAGMTETADGGKYTALDIKVCNMSLGGATLHAGRDIEDQLTKAFLEKDILLVVAASNAGPSGITVGSPGTGFGSLTVGASSSAPHERILRRVQYGASVGPLYRPFMKTQMAYFSSRGPSADGRPEIEVVANGFGSYGQGFAATTNGISLGSGTSFAAPTVAGVAAVLRQAVPSATALQVRNALIASANPGLIEDGSDFFDRGAGMVDAAAALAILQGNASRRRAQEGETNVNVPVNLLQGSGIQTITGNVTRSVKGLLPGQRFETFYRVNPNTAAVVVKLSGVTPGPVVNQRFGDDILLAVHSAKTSAIGEGDYPVFEFTTGGTFVIEEPELGVMRVTLNGDWTNASPIDATVQIYSLTFPVPGMSLQGRLLDGGQVAVPFTVPAGAKTLDLRLEWQGDWASYPANDVDLILVDPDDGFNVDGATLNVPEVAAIADPKPGRWLAVIDGFSVNTRNGDRFQLRVSVDGVVLK